MGMLITHHEGYFPEPEAEDPPKRTRKPKAPEADPDE